MVCLPETGCGYTPAMRRYGIKIFVCRLINIVFICVKECDKAHFRRHGALMVTMSDGFKQLTRTFYHRPAQSLNMSVQNKLHTLTKPARISYLTTAI